MCDIDKDLDLDIFFVDNDNDILLSVFLCWYLGMILAGRGQQRRKLFIFFIFCTVVSSQQ